MATSFLARTLVTFTKKQNPPNHLFSRSFTSKSLFSVSSFFLSSTSSSVPTSVLGLLGGSLTDELRSFPFLVGLRRCHATTPSSSSLNDCPPTEDLLGGCDFKHWLIVMNKPEGDPSRDELIESYIKTLAMVVGSEDEARKQLYSVSTRFYYGFGCSISEELSDNMKELPGVHWALPDSYMDAKNKSYGGEPFINGQAVPYDPKYHEELSKWTRSNPPDYERSRHSDRPCNFDRSRNFIRRTEIMQNRNVPT